MGVTVSQIPIIPQAPAITVPVGIGGDSMVAPAADMHDTDAQVFEKVYQHWSALNALDSCGSILKIGAAQASILVQPPRIYKAVRSQSCSVERPSTNLD